MDKLQLALKRLEQLHSQDPVVEYQAGKEWPRELLYAERLLQRLRQVVPQASEALYLALYSEHLQRWQLPRDQYPLGVKGYKAWRSELARRQADIAAQLLVQVGYDASFIERVKALMQKQHLKQDAEVQALEDVACLVFLEYYLEPFAQQYTEEKVIDILRKTLKKMSSAGHKHALALPLSPTVRNYLDKSLARV